MQNQPSPALGQASIAAATGTAAPRTMTTVRNSETITTTVGTNPDAAALMDAVRKWGAQFDDCDGVSIPERSVNGRVRTEQLKAAPASKDDPRPYVQLQLGGRRLCALVDSGAVLSYISEGASRRLGSTAERRSIRTVARLADERQRAISREISVWTSIGRYDERHTFLELPGLERDIIVGMDLLRKAGFEWSLSESTSPQKAPPDALATVHVDSGGLSLCTTEQRERLDAFLDEMIPQFDKLRGVTPLATHRIRLRAAQEPIRQRHRIFSPALQAIVDAEVDQMLAEGCIEPAASPWNSGVVLAREKDGRHRFFIDFRRINDMIERDAYPLPPVQRILDRLREARFLSTIDLRNDGYWQVPLAEESRPLTAFAIPNRGQFQFKVMPFGLHSASATFQRLLDGIIGPDLAPRAFAHLDDVIVLGRTLDEHLANLREVLRRLLQANLRINAAKCHFLRPSLTNLGRVVDREGSRADPEKIRAIANFPPTPFTPAGSSTPAPADRRPLTVLWNAIRPGQRHRYRTAEGTYIAKRRRDGTLNVRFRP